MRKLPEIGNWINIAKFIMQGIIGNESFIHEQDTQIIFKDENVGAISIGCSEFFTHHPECYNETTIEALCSGEEQEIVRFTDYRSFKLLHEAIDEFISTLPIGDGVAILRRPYYTRETNINLYLDKHVHEVTPKFSIAKAAEEAAELSTSLIQALTKPHKKEIVDDITHEIADVELNISILKRIYKISDEDILIVKETKIQKLTMLKDTIKQYGIL